MGMHLGDMHLNAPPLALASLDLLHVPTHRAASPTLGASSPVVSGIGTTEAFAHNHGIGSVSVSAGNSPAVPAGYYCVFICNQINKAPFALISPLQPNNYI